MKEITIDFIKGVKIDLDNSPIENIQALNYLKEGIFNLAGIVKNKELKISKNSSDVTENGFVPGKETLYYWSNNNKDNDLLLCQFNWFVISCINYIRIIGLIDIMNQKGWKTTDIKDNSQEIKDYCCSYVEGVVPELLKWRNKISAHPSITDPKSKSDNLGLLEFSIMNQLTFQSSHYFAGGFNWSKEGEESQLEKWSLIQIFEDKLIPRYWPDIEVKGV